MVGDALSPAEVGALHAEIDRVATDHSSMK
jgi:hypothetical protein